MVTPFIKQHLTYISWNIHGKLDIVTPFIKQHLTYISWNIHGKLDIVTPFIKQLLTYISWNIHGKLDIVTPFIKQHFSEIDFIHVSETHHKKGAPIPDMCDYVPISSASTLGLRTRGGNIVYVKKKNYSKLTKIVKKDWYILLELFTTILIFLYIPPEDSVFNSSKLVTQLDNMIELHLQKGNSIHIFGDHNARFGDMNEIFSMTYSQNIDESKNKNGDIFGVLYENRNIYPINHLKTREIEIYR